jgi:GNAT superfamily N-acetyltransferase
VSDGISFERARARDLPELLALDVPLVARPRQEQIVRESVAAGGCLVARAAGAIGGYLTWDVGFFQRPFVRLLAVAQACRRRGFGAALLASAERELLARGSTELFVSTETINVPMRTLLLHAAYVSSGSIDHINEPGNAELVFYKRLA